MLAGYGGTQEGTDPAAVLEDPTLEHRDAQRRL